MGFLSGAFFFLPLSDLLHEATHGGSCLVLFLSGSIGVGPQGETRVEVAKYGGHCFHIHTVLQGRGSEGVPLRYNKDKRKNPVFSRVSAFVVAYSIPFPTLIVNEKSVE